MKKLLTGLLVLCILTLAAAAGCITAPPDQEYLGTPWINSDIVGNIPNDPGRLQDDFHLASNHHWLSTSKIPSGEAGITAFAELEMQHQAELLRLLNNITTPKTHEEDLLLTLYNSVKDMDARNAQGMQPILPELSRIKNISTLDELSAWLTDSGYHLANPLAILTVTVDPKNSSAYIVGIDPIALSLGSKDEYKNLTKSGEQLKQNNDHTYEQLLIHAGYSQEEAQALNRAVFAVEAQIADGRRNASDLTAENRIDLIYNPRTLEQLRAESPAYPLAEILTAKGYDRGSPFVLSEPQWLAALNAAYTEKNLEGLKGLLIQNTLKETAQYLDQKCLDIYNERIIAKYGISGTKTPEQMAYDAINTKLGVATGRVYADAYFSEEIKTDITEMIERIRETFKQRLTRADWLTNETRDAAVEKLDAITINVCYPEIWTDYSALALRSAAEGGSAAENILKIAEFEADRQKHKIGTTVVKGEWSECMPQEVNAFYSPESNSLNIPAGILGGVFYDPNGSYESQLGSIGMIIGHEFTHAFDTTGSQYDKDGNLRNWWTDTDRNAFRNHTAKVAAYYETILPYPDLGVDGDMTIGETVADLGGLACMMDIAGTIEGFDYEEFFTSFSHIWRKMYPEQMGRIILETDEHPPGYVRTNVNVQQVQEFYTTFNVTAKDGMYLAPEDRLVVW